MSVAVEDGVCPVCGRQRGARSVIGRLLRRPCPECGAGGGRGTPRDDPDRAESVVDLVIAGPGEASPLVIAAANLGPLRGATVLAGPGPNEKSLRLVYEAPVALSSVTRLVRESHFEFVRFWKPEPDAAATEDSRAGASFRTYDLVVAADERPRAFLDAARRELGLAACASVPGPGRGELSLQLVFDGLVPRSELKALAAEAALRVVRLVAVLEELRTLDEPLADEDPEPEDENGAPRPGDRVLESFGLPPRSFARSVRDSADAAWELLRAAARALRDLPLPDDDRRR